MPQWEPGGTPSVNTAHELRRNNDNDYDNYDGDDDDNDNDKDKSALYAVCNL